MKRTLTCLLMCCWWAWAGAQTTFLTEDFSTGTTTTPPSGWVQNQLYSFSAATAANDFWHFDNPGARATGGNFSGNFAIFDSDNYSIDGFYENIALESPAFSTQGHDSVYLVLDYMMYAGGTAEGNVEVYNGNAWVIAKQYPNATVSATHDSINISNFGRNNCSTRIRFRWSSNSGGAWLVDNVKVFSYSNGKNQNVSVKAIEAPLAGVCGNAATTVEIRVKNDGLGTAGNFPVTFSMFDGLNTQTVTQIVTAGIATCKDSLISFSTPVDMSYDSNFRIVVYTGLPGDEQLVNSDTMRIASLRINQPPIFPSPVNKLICGIGPYKDSVEVGPGDNAFWYNQMADDNPVLTGRFYNIEPLNEDTTYYVETYRAKRDRYPVPNLNPNIGFITPPTSAGIYVDIIAKADIVLDSMEISCVALGSFTYQVNARKGTYLPYITTNIGWTQVLNTTITPPAGTFKVWVGSIKVNAGDTLGLYFYNSSNNGIVFTSGPVIRENDAIKYISNNVNAAGIFGGTQLPNYGYGGTFFYTRPCYSPRVARELQVKPRPKGSIAIQASPFEGTFNTGTIAQPDVVAAGDELNYEITPPSGYTNAGHGTTWQISGISVTTRNGTPVPAADYATTMPGSSANGKFRFIPSSPFTDSLIWVQVTIMDMGSGNCDSIVNRYIIIAPKGDPGFQIPTSICAGQPAEFINTSKVSSGGLLSKWDFGDGDSSYDISPVHTYTAPGTYNVRLVVTTSPYGYVTDTLATITVKPVPTVDFKTQNACDGDSVGFLNKTISGSGTPTYLWDFGDSETASGENAAHLYATVGKYTVTLIASLNGCDISKTKQAIQYDNPVADFTAEVACVLEEVQFTNMSSVPNGQLGYYWDFGDGTYGTAQNPAHGFGQAASFTVKLIASSEFGCKDTTEKLFNADLTPQADFTNGMICGDNPAEFTNLTQEPAGITVAYTWYFDNGDSSQVKNAQHVYNSVGTRMVTLRAVGSNGCSSAIDKEVTVNVMPVADFTVADGCSGSQFYFMNSSTNSNNTVMMYSWAFDDGNSSTDGSPLHTYTVATNTAFNASLIAEGNGGCRDTVVKEVKVGYVPNCEFTVTNKGNRTYSFEPSQTTDVTYSWSFGDGGTSTDQSPQYQYPVYSNYPVTLTATTISGTCTCEMQRLLSVNLGIGQSQDMSSFISLYPNPSSGKLAIEVDGNFAGNIEMQVYNVLGEKVRNLDTRQFKGGLFEVDLSDLASGVYLLQVNAPGKTVQTLRFTMNK